MTAMPAESLTPDDDLSRQEEQPKASSRPVLRAVLPNDTSVISVELPDGKSTRVVLLPPPMLPGDPASMTELSVDPFDPNIPPIAAPGTPTTSDVTLPRTELTPSATVRIRELTRRAAMRRVPEYPEGAKAYLPGEYKESSLAPRVWSYCIIDGFQQFPDDQLSQYKAMESIIGASIYPKPNDQRIILKRNPANKALSDSETNLHNLLIEMSQTYGARLVFLS